MFSVIKGSRASSSNKIHHCQFIAFILPKKFLSKGYWELLLVVKIEMTIQSHVQIDSEHLFHSLLLFLIWTASWQNQQCGVRPTKTQISLGIRPVWSESSLCAQWVAEGPSFPHADSEDSDQTGRMPRLIWVFARRTLTLLVLSQGGSYFINILAFEWR